MNNILESIAERWDTHAESYDSHHHGNKTCEDICMWKDVLKAYLGNDLSAEVLDVGAGTGFLTILISELGYHCVGLDISKGMLDIARQHAEEKKLDVEFIQSAVENIPFDENSKDIITNCSFMWTLVNPDIVLKEWLRVLKANGKLICFCTIGDSIMQSNHYTQEIEDILPLKGASEKKLVEVLSNAGFKEVEAICLKELKNNHGDKAWYIIKGKK